MRRIGPLSLEGALILLCGVMLLVGVTTCNARRDGQRQERVAQLERNAYKSTLAGIAARRSTDSLAALSIRQADIVKQQGRRLTTLGRTLDAVLAANDSLLAGDSVDVPTLRLALARTTEVARLYKDSTQVLLSAVLFSIAAHEAERQAWLAEREANTRLIAAKDSVISALRESGQACRILFVACPSRVQSVGIGAGIVLLLIL